jgi:hypothetical protein
MIRHFLITTAALSLLVPSDASAIVLFNLDNASNQTDPGGSLPWTSVGKVSNSAGTALTGSAVYLGDGYLLTANHVTMNSTFRYVTFDNSTFYEFEATFNDGVRSYGKQVAANVDMAVVKLTSIPMGVSTATLLTSPSETIAPATLIGWGLGRNPASPLASNNVTWGDGTTAAKRWGENVPKSLTSVVYQSGSYEALMTITGNSTGGLGNAEAGLTTYDSGGGFFQNISGTWYLIGVNTAVEVGGVTTFGPDVIPPGSPRGNINVFARVSTYDTQIMALVPEPSTLAFGVTGAAFSVLFLWRRKARCRSDGDHQLPNCRCLGSSCRSASCGTGHEVTGLQEE